jgi:DNA-binding response OmpR family regulator
MLTALHDVSHRIRGIESGADDFLTKPFNREELLTRVKSLLRIKTLHDDIETKNRYCARWSVLSKKPRRSLPTRNAS